MASLARSSFVRNLGWSQYVQSALFSSPREESINALWQLPRALLSAFEAAIQSREELWTWLMGRQTEGQEG